MKNITVKFVAFFSIFNCVHVQAHEDSDYFLSRELTRTANGLRSHPQKVHNPDKPTKKIKKRGRIPHTKIHSPKKKKNAPNDNLPETKDPRIVITIHTNPRAPLKKKVRVIKEKKARKKYNLIEKCLASGAEKKKEIGETSTEVLLLTKKDSSTSEDEDVDILG